MESSQQTYMEPTPLTVLLDTLQELVNFEAIGIREHNLLNVGAAKRICSTDWLERSGCKPDQTFPLSPNLHRFRF